MNIYFKQVLSKVNNEPQVNPFLRWIAIALLPIYGKVRKTHIVFYHTGQLLTSFAIRNKKEKII